MTLALYPWEDAELLVAEQAVEALAADAEYDAWLTAIDEAWLDDVLADVETDDFTVDAEYIPFQSVPDDWGRGSMCDEPGYAESRCPYLF